MRDILKDSGGARKVAALWDELSGFFASFDAYRQRKGVSRDRALYLELFNGGPRTIDRAGKRCVFVPNWSACISGTITPSVLSEVFEKLNTDGLLQRFLLYQAELLGPGEDRKPLYAAEDKLVNVVQRLLSFKPNPGGTTTKLTDGAQAVREKFEQLVEFARYLPGNSEALNAHLNKYSGFFCRLTLTYHMVKCQAERLDTSTPVDSQTALMAAKALIDYHLPTARAAYRQIGFGNNRENAAKDIAGYILSKELGEVSARDLSRSVWSVKKDIGKVRTIMPLLEVFGWVKCKKFVGNNPTQWSVNPRVHKLFQDRAKKERKQRKLTRDKIKAAVKIFSGGNRE